MTLDTKPFMNSPTNTDPTVLRKELCCILVNSLIGKPYLFGKPMYADETSFHFGTVQQFVSPRGSIRTRGTHSLLTRESVWMLNSHINNAFIGSYDLKIKDEDNKELSRQSIPEDVLSSGAFVAPDSVVIDIKTFIDVTRKSFGVLVALSDSSELVIFPTKHDDIDGEIADFQLYSPKGLLSVGPGLTWHFQSAE